MKKVGNINAKKSKKYKISNDNIINIDYHSREAIYEQIINQIERYVALGILKSGEQIPSTRELASILGINPNTVRKAYLELENKNIINTISTKGTFISDNTKEAINIKRNKLLEELKEKVNELEKLGMNKEDIIKNL